MNTLIKFNQSLLIAGFLTLTSAPVLAAPLTAVPNTFAAGETIVADEMNENFTAIVDGISNIALTPGPQGETGADGGQGIQGPIGNTGAQGGQGFPGIQGVIGNTGAKGDPGIQGGIGNAGAKGDPGIQGIIGNAGAKGDPGIQGVIGNTGAQGDQGIQGGIGNTGNDGSSCTVTRQTDSASIECPIGTIVSVFDGAAGSSVSGNTQGDMQYWNGTDWVLVAAPSITGEATLKFVNGSPSWTYTPVVYSIGDTGPAGGIVFYITDGGAHGLEAAPADQNAAVWGCPGAPIGSTGTAIGIGTGAQNTLDIVASCTTEVTAANVADAYTLNGYNDWFLPSKDELQLLNQQKVVVGGFVNGNYWSSSESNSNSSWYLPISVGTLSQGGKSATLGVRAVRAF